MFDQQRFPYGPRPATTHVVLILFSCCTTVAALVAFIGTYRADLGFDDTSAGLAFLGISLVSAFYCVVFKRAADAVRKGDTYVELGPQRLTLRKLFETNLITYDGINRLDLRQIGRSRELEIHHDGTPVTIQENAIATPGVFDMIVKELQRRAPRAPLET